MLGEEREDRVRVRSLSKRPIEILAVTRFSIVLELDRHGMSKNVTNFQKHDDGADRRAICRPTRAVGPDATLMGMMLRETSTLSYYNRGSTIAW
jgi:hypothetical protein